VGVAHRDLALTHLAATAWCAAVVGGVPQGSGATVRHVAPTAGGEGRDTTDDRERLSTVDDRGCAVTADDRVVVTVEHGVADVRLVRAEKRNALDRRMFQAIIDAADGLAADRSVRVVVLSGEGPGFCAGLDVSLFAAMAEGSPDASDVTAAIRDEAAHAVRVWVELDQPVLAAVHGVAVGGGLQLALGADLRIVAPDAQLGLFEIRWGIVPDMGGTQLLPRLVGPDVAKELMFSGRAVSGREAHGLGLATRVADDPRATALELAADIAGRNPRAIKVIKALVDRSWSLSFPDGFREESALTDGIIGTPNQVEAVRANLEQRPGRFAD
jgi:enoyl-CoA hydratase/carnithine racemase